MPRRKPEFHIQPHTHTQQEPTNVHLRPMTPQEQSHWDAMECEFCGGTYGCHQLDEDGDPCVIGQLQVVKADYGNRGSGSGE